MAKPEIKVPRRRVKLRNSRSDIARIIACKKLQRGFAFW
jgi:hypothetical protein